MSGLPFPELPSATELAQQMRASRERLARPYDSEGHSADYLTDDDEGFLLDDVEDRCAECGDTLHQRDDSPYCVGCRMIQKADET